MKGHEDQERAEAVDSAPLMSGAGPGLAAGGLVGQAQWLQRAAGNRATGRFLARKVEMRKPGSKWPSAYERRAELVDKINAQTYGVLYSLGSDDRLTYKVLGSLAHFDKKMIEFIDAGDVIPLLLVTNDARTTEGYTSGMGETKTIQKRVLIDSFGLGLFDLDDMLRSTDESFQLNLIHVLTERLFVKDYEKKFPKNRLGASFHGGHDAALEAELAHLRDMFADPSIEYLGEWDDTARVIGNQFMVKVVHGSGISQFTYRSKNEGYTIIHELTLGLTGEQAGALYVKKKGEKQRVPARQFIEERATATRK